MTYQVPEGILTNGATYSWYMQACYQSACSNKTPTQTFTIDTSLITTTETGTPASATLTTSDFTAYNGITNACSGSSCALTTKTTAKIGGDGTHIWATGIKPKLTKIPVGAMITTATLNLTQSACYGCVGIDPDPSWAGTLDVYPADSDVASLTTGPQLKAAADSTLLYQKAVKAKTVSADITSAFQDWTSSGGVNNGLVLEADNPDIYDGVTYSVSIVVNYRTAAAPTKPTQLNVVPGDSGVYATWDAPQGVGDSGGVTGYVVKAFDSSGSIAKTINTTDDHTVIDSLGNGASYTISVAAINSTNTGSATVSAPITPTAIAGGSSTYTQVIQQFLDAKSGLQSGQYADAASAVAASSSGALFANQLTAEQAISLRIHSALATSNQAMSNPLNSITNTLVVPSSDGTTVTVYASDSFTYSTITATDTSSPGSEPSYEDTNYRFSFTAGSSPTLTGYVDADQADSTATATDTAASDQEIQNAPAVGSMGTFNIADVGTDDGQSTLPPGVTTQTGYYPNRQGVANWAWNNAYSHNNNGYSPDCTDFASRALHTGGGMSMSGSSWMLHHTNDHYWAHNSFGATSSWGGAKHLANYLNLSGSFWMTSYGQAGIGNIIFANWSGGSFGGISHTGVIVAISRGIFIAQHSRNVRESIAVWQAAYGGHGSFWIAWVHRK
ncbi:hypothetical protein GCM10023196_056820 [Actinoallomurus vinaceus]|uniref:Fibronectin type-III domain-containing protein n=1 Tax=Actinoallomurus vinaceus TaxID=1080074 RepID=A0ABP8UF35_9ACTN